jgi:beta-phosphoglucomutase-like phosphatase (HAD superfamily)
MTAAARLGLQVEACLAVENAPAGVQSARSAGLPCVGLPTYLDPDDIALADRIFDTIGDLVDWLKAYRLENPTGRWNLAANPDRTKNEWANNK